MTDVAQDLLRLRSALIASGELAYEWHLPSDALLWIGGAADAFGLSEPWPTGRALDDHIHPEDLSRRADSLARLRPEARNFDCEYRVRGTGGTYRSIHDCGMAEFSMAGQAVLLRGTVRPLSSRLRTDTRLEYLASYDDLTGHYNRTRLRDALDQALAYRLRYGANGAYAVIGIDNLTLLNQAFGHEIADTAIIAIGQRLDSCMRASDIIGRVGGDRFGVVLANCPHIEIAVACERILDAIRAAPIETAAGPVRVTASVGAVAFPDGARTAADLMSKADAALQQAKGAGRNRHCIYAYTEEQLRTYRRNLVIAEQVQRALREDRLVFAYQPIVDSRTRSVSYYECLVRMTHPDGEVSPAGSFMPVVEELGMIRALDQRVLELAIAELTRYPQARLTFNVSALTTIDRVWRRNAVSFLRGNAALASRLVIEITETAGLEDLDECTEFVTTLKALGCRIALDDFGAGYSSFRHIKGLAVDLVKIAGSFIKNIGVNSDNLVFVRTLLDLARNFGIETVAECVETESEAQILIREGVGYLQGFAIGRPTLARPWSSAGGMSRPLGLVAEGGGVARAAH